MTVKRTLTTFICLLASARLWPLLAHAEGSAGFDVQGGVGTTGFDLSGSLDIKPDPSQKPWEASVSDSYLHTKVGTESKTNQFVLGVSHEVDANREGHGQLTFGKDSINDVKYAGPTFGVTYTWLEGGPSAAFTPKGHAYDENTADTPNSSEHAEGAESAALTLDADLFFYSTDVSVSSRTVQVGQRQVVLRGGSGTVHDTMFHPNVSFEKPLLDETLTPYAIAGHYFYSTDPAAIENVAGRPRFASAAGRLTSLVGGLLENNAEVGIRFLLPAAFAATTRLGAEQTATDRSWATIQGVSLSRRFWEHLKAKLEWTRTIQYGASADLFAGGLTYYFN
jgi:hypothetical protein